MTGIILNNEMEYFSKPTILSKHGTTPVTANITLPIRRPLSSMAPSIFTDEVGNVRLVIGGAGGMKIITSVAYVSICNFFNKVLALHDTAVYQMWSVS